MSVVIDHGAKPSIPSRADSWGGWDRWRADMRALARDTQATVKLSGLVTEAGPEWTTDDLHPFVDVLLEHFGPERLLWGSDWPVVELAGGYDRWRASSLDLLAALDAEDREAVLGGTAARVYGLDPATGKGRRARTPG
jgi:L-fuconolactonase